MLKSYRYLHLDVFTDRLFGGNQLAVVLDGRGLSTGAMQAIAKEMNFSETTFVQPPERPDTAARVRIFTPAEELPMAGHPTIGYPTYALLRRAGIVVLAPSTRSRSGSASAPRPCSLEWKGEELSFVLDSRMLAPGAGIQEDPRLRPRRARQLPVATQGRDAPKEAGTMLNVQGVRMGRPSYIHIAIGVDGGVISERACRRPIGLRRRGHVVLVVRPSLARPARLNPEDTMTRHLVLIGSALVSVAAVAVAAQSPDLQKLARLRNPAALTEQAPATFRANFDTSAGSFVVEAHREWAPIGADRFYNLVKNGFYDDIRFYRVIPKFMAQFGIDGNPDY